MEAHLPEANKTNGVDTENVVDVVQCSEEFTDLKTGNTKQLFSKYMAEHRRSNSSGLSSEVYLHHRDNDQTFQDSDKTVESARRMLPG